MSTFTATTHSDSPRYLTLDLSTEDLEKLLSSTCIRAVLSLFFVPSYPLFYTFASSLIFNKTLSSSSKRERYKARIDTYKSYIKLSNRNVNLKNDNYLPSFNYLDFAKLLKKSLKLSKANSFTVDEYLSLSILIDVKKFGEVNLENFCEFCDILEKKIRERPINLNLILQSFYLELVNHILDIKEFNSLSSLSASSSFSSTSSSSKSPNTSASHPMKILPLHIITKIKEIIYVGRSNNVSCLYYFCKWLLISSTTEEDDEDYNDEIDDETVEEVEEAAQYAKNSIPYILYKLIKRINKFIKLKSNLLNSSMNDIHSSSSFSPLKNKNKSNSSLTSLSTSPSSNEQRNKLLNDLELFKKKANEVQEMLKQTDGQVESSTLVWEQLNNLEESLKISRNSLYNNKSRNREDEKESLMNQTMISLDESCNAIRNAMNGIESEKKKIEENDFELNNNNENKTINNDSNNKKNDKFITNPNNNINSIFNKKKVLNNNNTEKDYKEYLAQNIIENKQNLQNLLGVSINFSTNSFSDTPNFSPSSTLNNNISTFSPPKDSINISPNVSSISKPKNLFRSPFYRQSSGNRNHYDKKQCCWVPSNNQNKKKNSTMSTSTCFASIPSKYKPNQKEERFQTYSDLKFGAEVFSMFYNE